MKRTTLAAALLLASTAGAAATPDTEAVEFFNTGTGKFFITASARDVTLIEQGAAGPGWVRTGRSFQAWSSAATAPAGAAAVCRFYSNLANSHFFTASAGECAQLKAMEAAERATGKPMQGWMFEGTAFFVEAPQANACAAGTVALQRFYNLGYERGIGGNHRFVDDADLKSAMIDAGWVAESTAFCSQAKAATGTLANLAATTTDFSAVAGTWKGSGKFEIETATSESEVRKDLSLTFADDGAVTGAGYGCTFTGQLASGDGFRSLFVGKVTASGCTDPAFDGDYLRVKIQRFDTALQVKLKQGDDATEVSLEATLAADSTTAPPPVTPPGAAGFDAVAGDWAGTVKWEVETATAETEVNKALKLAIGKDGAFTGEGFGCTITGQLANTGASASAFGGSAKASGCENTAFNGDLPRVRVTVLPGARLQVELKREDATGEVSIAGKVDSGGTTTTTNPNTGTGNPTGSGNPSTTAPKDVTGAWKGSAQLEVGSAKSTETLALTVGADGTVSGTGAGCTFAGVLQLNGARSKATGSLTASGCTNAAVNGTFRDITLELDDKSLEVELERQSGNTRVRVKASLARA